MKKQILLLLVCCSLIVSAQNYPIGTRTITYTDAARSNRSIGVDFYYPAVSAGANTTLAADSFPVVVFGHGFVISTADYSGYADSLAKRGFIVALPSTESSTSASHPNFAQDLIFVLNQVISDGKTNSSSPFYQKVVAKGAIGGHSMGGGSTVLSCSYSNPATCYFTFGAANTTPSSISAAKFMTKPYLDISGLKDCVAPPSTNQIPMYDSSTSPCKYYIGLANATHCQFATGGATLCYAAEGFVSGCASSPYLTKTQQTEGVLTYLLPYLYYYLKGSCPAWTQFQTIYTADVTNTKKSSCNNVVPSNPSITGTTSFCAGSNTTLTANPAGFSYTWSNGISTQTNTVTAANTYGVSISNGICTITATPVAVTVNNPPATPAAISSVDTVCASTTGITFTTSSSGATSFSWTVPSGWNITSANNTASITVTAGTAGGQVTVAAVNSCGATSTINKTIVIRPKPNAPTAINATDSVCANATSIVLTASSVNGATGYNWSLPSGWSITSTPTNANSVTVTAGSTGGNISVTAVGQCGNSTSTIKSIGIRPLPASPTIINGNATVCTNGSGILYDVPLVNGATTYNWTLPSGWNITNGIGTNAITASAGASGGTISVTASNACGSSNPTTKSVSVTQGLSAPGVITSSADTVCGTATGVTYSVGVVSGATGYAWTLPVGWNITSGNNTDSITVSASTTGGTISVAAIGNCGNGPASTKIITVKNTPVFTGVITGNDTVCINQGTAVFSISAVPDAFYTWAVPSAWVIDGGQNTTILAVSNITVSGTVSVAVSNSCGVGNSVGFNVLAKDTPAPTISASGNVLSSSVAGASYQWYLNGQTIPNATSSTYTVLQDGNYKVLVTDGFGCSGWSASFAYKHVGIQTISSENALVKIYPNPATDKLTIETQLSAFDVMIYDAIGKEVRTAHATDAYLVLSVKDLTEGMYFIRIKSQEFLHTASFVKW